MGKIEFKWKFPWVWLTKKNRGNILKIVLERAAGNKAEEERMGYTFPY